MNYLNYIILCLIISTPTINAEEIEKGTITSCAYQAGTAREVQTIRQSEGDEWIAFEAKVKSMYSDTQGRTDLLTIAKNVYLKPAEQSAAEIYSFIFSACVKRYEGLEPSA
jgi:hypothetical protein